MPYDEPPDDEEDWYDDEDELSNEETAACPECGTTIYAVTEKCPACGYWLSPEDRRAMWSGAKKPRWLTITAWIILAALVIPMIALVLAFLRSVRTQ